MRKRGKQRGNHGNDMGGGAEMRAGAAYSHGTIALDEIEK